MARRSRAQKHAEEAAPTPPARSWNNPRTYSPEEARRQLQVVEQLLKSGATGAAIARRVTQAEGTSPTALGIGAGRAHKLVARVKELWARDDQNMRATWKSAQIRRLTEDIAIARGQQRADGTWVLKPDLKSLRSFESLLADVQGTREPIQINVDVRYTEAMMMVIGTMDPETMARAIAETEEAMRLAERFRREHPELTDGAITVDAAAEE